MKKKIIIISAVLLVLIIGVLTIKSLIPGKTDLLSGLNTDEVAKESLKEATLTFYFEASEPRDTRKVLDAVELRAKNKVNIKLDFQFINAPPDSYLSLIKSKISSGQPCDAFLYYSDGFSQTLKSLAEEGLVKDLTKLFPDKAPDYYNEFSKDAITAMSVNNKIYAIPSNVPTSQMRCAIVRDDLMKKYNLPDIKSYEDYEFYLETIKHNEPDMIPMTFYETAIGLFAETNGYVILDYQQGLVYKWDDPDMKIIAWEQTPEFKKGINTIQKWYSSEYLLKDIGPAQIDDSVVTSGKWASFISSYGSQFEYNSTLLNRKSVWKYIAYPLSPDKISARNSPLNAAIAINAKSTNADRVVMFLNWLQSSQENYDSLMYGIKGTHYTLEDNKIKIPEGIKTENSNLSWPWRYPFRNIQYERADGSTDEDSIKEYNKIINTKTKYPPHMGFVPDYTSVQDTTILRNMSFYETEQLIYSGSFKQEDIDTYIKSQKYNGVEKLVSEVQRQLDKWKTENKKSN